MTDAFVAPEVVQERMQRLVEVVERHALRKHEARVGRTEEVLVEGPSKTRPGDVVGPHPPEQARALRARTTRPGPASSSRSASRSAAPHWLRGELIGAGQGRAAPARAHPGRGGVTRHLAIVGPTASGKSALALAVAGALGDVEIVSLDSMQVYRGMDIGTAKPTPAERARGPSPSGRRRRSRPRSGRCAPRRPRRGPRSPTSRRAAGGRCSSAAPGSTCGPSSTTCRVPPRDARRARRARARDRDRRRAWRARTTRLATADPVAAARIEPGNARRIVRALEVIEPTGPPVLVVRRRPRRVRAAGDRRRPGRRLAAASRARPAHRGPVRRDARRGPRRRGAGARRAARRPVAHGARRRSGTRRSSPTSTARSRRSGRRSTWPCAARGGSPAASGSGSGATRGSAGSARPRNPDDLAAVVLALWGRDRRDRRGRPHMTVLQLAKLHATGNDFLVRLALDGDARRARARRRVARSATATAGSAPTGSSRSGPASRRRRRLHDDAAERRRRRRRDERQRHPLPGVGRGPRRPRHAATSSSSTPRPAAASSRSTRDAAGDVVAADVDMGRGHRSARRTSRSSPSTASSIGATPPASAIRTSCASSTIPTAVPGHRARTADRARRPLPEPHERRVRRACTRPTASPCGCGSAASGETLSCGTGACAAAAVAHQRGLVDERVRVDVPGGELDGRARRRPCGSAVRSCTCSTSTSTSPVESLRVEQTLVTEPSRAHQSRQRRRLTATEVDLGRVRQRALLVGTGLRHRHGRGGGGVARRARVARRHRGRRAGRTPSCSAGARPTPRPTSARARPRSCGAVGAGARRRRRDLRRRAHARAATQPREAVRGRRRRSRRADPRHLRPARDEPGGRGAGRARAAALPVAAPARPRARSSASRVRASAPGVRVRRSSRSTAGACCAACRSSNATSSDLGRDARDAAQGAQAPRRPARRARRLHERGQVDAAQPAHGRGRARARTSCSRRSIPRRAGCGCPAARRVVLSDTVGFVRRLPHQLVEAFRSTLEEVVDADLLVHVVDASAPDVEARIDAVEHGAARDRRRRRAACCSCGTRPTSPTPTTSKILLGAHPGSVAVSAATGARRRPSCSRAIGDRLRALAPHRRVRRAVRPRRRARRAAPRGRGARGGARRARRRACGPGSPKRAAGRFAEYASDARLVSMQMAATGGFVPPPYPYDRLDALEAARRLAARAVSSTARSARRATRCPRSRCAAAAAALAASNGLPAVGRQRRAARRRGGVDRPPLRRRGRGRARRRVRRHQGARRVAAAPAAPAQPAARHRAVSRDRVPELRDGRGRSPAAARCRCRSTRDWHLDLDAISDADAERALRALGQRARQPDGVGGRRRATSRASPAWARARGVVVASDECYAEFAPRARDDPRERARRRARDAQPVEALEPRGHAGRLLRGRPRARRVPRRDAQARGPHGAGAGAGRGRGRARRRRARRRAARPLRRAPRRSCATRSRRTASCTTAATPRSTSGCGATDGADDGWEIAARLAHEAGPARRRPAISTARAAPTTCGSRSCSRATGSSSRSTGSSRRRA